MLTLTTFRQVQPTFQEHVFILLKLVKMIIKRLKLFGFCLSEQNGDGMLSWRPHFKLTTDNTAHRFPLLWGLATLRSNLCSENQIVTISVACGWKSA